MEIVIDADACTACGLCVELCPSSVMVRGEGRVQPDPETARFCFACGHCMAACPTRAIHVEGLDYAAFADLAGAELSADAFSELLRSRRSARRFTAEPVARADLERILEMVTLAPAGLPPTPVEALVFSERAQIEAILPAVVSTYEKFARGLQSAVIRPLIRRQVGAAVFPMLRSFVTELMLPACRRYREFGEDCFTWGAPAMLLFYADRTHLSARDDCLIACTYAHLAAHALGLGSTMIGVVAPAIDRAKSLRRELGIPDGAEVFISLVVGHQRGSFRRAIPRRLKSVRWLTR